MIIKKYKIIVESVENSRGYYQAFFLEAKNKEEAIIRLRESCSISDDSKIDEVSLVGLKLGFKMTNELTSTGKSYFNINDV